ncbi:MAG: branched-chain amino acid ABC transporter substrate-binding protein [Pseudomonadota bacterium]|nr:branched-chain amino acid ABC transporter substrate-binding protein [Pseudomonadota bacterium]
MNTCPTAPHFAAAVLLTSLLASTLAATSAQAQAAQEPQTVRIAHVGPISGPAGHIGKDTENGVRMAIDDANAQKPVIGGQRVRFALQAEDDQGDPSQAANVAQRLCDAKVAGVVGHLQSGTSMPASGVYYKCGLPNITPAATNPELTRPGYNTTFRVIANDAALGAAVALYASDALGLKKIAVIDDRTAYGQGVTELFKTTAREKGMNVVATEFTRDRAVDFLSILTTIRAQDPDAIFYGGLDAQAGPMLRQMEQLGMDRPRFLGGDGLCTEMLPVLASKAALAERVVCATGGAAVEKMPGGLAWKKRYDTQYPGRFQIYSPYAYDAAMVLIEAMKRAGSTDPKVYLPALRATDHQGVTARIAFTSRGELTQPAVTFFTYKDKQRVPLN